MYGVIKYTGFKEMLDGRVKTLHQKYMLEFYMIDKTRITNIKCQNKISPIDLIVVNFLPFKSCNGVRKPDNIIENIDIGGPTMVAQRQKNLKM